jgi:hypothetical protein
VTKDHVFGTLPSNQSDLGLPGDAALSLALMKFLFNILRSSRICHIDGQVLLGGQ